MADVKSSEKVQPILGHLAELRKMLICVILTMLLGGIVCYAFFSEQLMYIFVHPVEQLGFNLIYTNVAESFSTHLRVALLGGIIATSPLVFWHIWRFISPALFPKEKRHVYRVLPLAILLFAGGVVFCYFLVIPLALRFFLLTTAGDLSAMLTVSDYVKFINRFLLPFGLLFELPLIEYFLTTVGMLSSERLKSFRKVVVVIILILAAVLTPPDVVSQIMLAVPVYLLYELGIKLSRLAERRRTVRAADEES